MNSAIKKAMLYNHQGIIMAREGKNKSALKDFNLAIKNYPNLPLRRNHDMRYRLYSNRGLTKEHLHNFKGALADYNHTLNLNPKYAIGYCNRGGIKYNLKHYIEAIPDFKRAIRYQSHYPKAWFFLGMAESRGKKLKAAIKTFTTLIQIIPKSFVPFFERGCVYLNLNQYSKAAQDFQKSLKLASIDDSSKVAILNNLGMTENNLHHYQQAKNHLQTALKIIPDNRYAITNLKIAQKGLNK